jgi:hypothetical protein
VVSERERGRKWVRGVAGVVVGAGEWGVGGSGGVEAGME